MLDQTGASLKQPVRAAATLNFLEIVFIVIGVITLYVFYRLKICGARFGYVSY